MTTTLRNRLALGALLAALAPFGAACGSSTTTDTSSGGTPDGGVGTCPTTGNGTLEVRVTGLPDGVGGSVSVEHSTTAVTTTTSLPLPAGVHRVTARRVSQADPIVRPVFDPTVDQPEPCVKDGETTTVNVAYAKIPTSNALWMSHGNATTILASLPGSSLRASGDATTSTYDPKVPAIANLAFDADGNLWFASGNVQRIKASALAAPGEAVPDVVLDADAFKTGVPGATGLAFDKEGSLWVSVVAAQKIVKIPASSLGATGSVTPAVVIDNTAFAGLDALAFDKDGNLFVANGSKVSMYKVARLGASTNAPPDVEIQGKTPQPVVGDLSDAAGLAFDKDGNLWVSYFASNAIAKYTPAELTAGGDVTPATQITIGVTTLLYAIAFDESGGLWFSAGAGKMGRFSPDQLVPSAMPVTPSTIVNGGTALGQVTFPAFFPAPAALPINPRVE